MPRVALALLLLALLVLALPSGFRPFYVLLYAILIASGLGYLWAWVQGRGLEASVASLDPYPQFGRPLQLRITIRERLGIPRSGLRAGLSGQKVASREAVLELERRGQATWITSVEDHHRGLNDVGALTVTTSDPLGLIHLERRIGEPHSVMVYPDTVDLSRWPSIGYAPLAGGGELSRRVDEGSSASRVREYLPGDKLVHIHWPSTARSNQLMTKEFDATGRSEEVWLVLDLHGPSQAGSGSQSTEEYGVTIAASLATAILDAGEPVGLLAQGHTVTRIPPNTGSDHLLEVLEALAVARAGGRAPLQVILANEGKELRQGSTVVAIAPWRGQDLKAIVEDCYRRDILLVPIFLDALSFDDRVRPQPERDGGAQPMVGASLISMGDDLTRSLSNVMERLVE